MLPAKKTPCNPGSFFGRSYPRALGKLDEDNHLIKGLDVQLPNKPFLQWAKKVDWNAGGTAVRPAGKQPKAPISAKEAYAQYLRSHAEKSVLSNAPESTEQHSSVAHLKEAAAQEAEENWEDLSAAEKKIFEDIAKEDAMRFQVEAVAHELRNPGWFKGWLARQGGPPAVGDPPADRVRPPMTPWMAFVHAILTKLKEQDPVLAASVSKLELMRLAMKEASPLYKKLSEHEKAGYVNLAKEDRARYDKELAENPQAQRRIEKTKKKKAAAAEAGKTKPKVRRSRRAKAAAEPDQAEPEVDTEGLTGMQAWAARKRAARQRQAERARKTQTKSKAAPRKRAPRKAAAEEAEEPEEEAGRAADGIQATPAELPDHAYIRTQATGEEGETESSSGEEAESDDDEDAISETESEEADSNAENGRGEASVIADTLGSLEDPLTQDNAESGLVGKVQRFVTDGIKWLTTGRKRRGVLTSMQAEGYKATPRKLEEDYEDRKGRNAHKRRRV